MKYSSIYLPTSSTRVARPPGSLARPPGEKRSLRNGVSELSAL